MNKGFKVSDSKPVSLNCEEGKYRCHWPLHKIVRPSDKRPGKGSAAQESAAWCSGTRPLLEWQPSAGIYAKALRQGDGLKQTSPSAPSLADRVLGSHWIGSWNSLFVNQQSVNRQSLTNTVTKSLTSRVNQSLTSKVHQSCASKAHSVIDKFANKKPLAAMVARTSSFSRAPCIMACLSVVGSVGTLFKSLLKTSWSEFPLVEPVKWRFRRDPTTDASRELHPGITTIVSIWERLKTSVATNQKHLKCKWLSILTCGQSVTGLSQNEGLIMIASSINQST